LSRTRRAGENTRMGGFELKRLKKLNGERLTNPSRLMLETSAIGRGPTAN